MLTGTVSYTTYPVVEPVSQYLGILQTISNIKFLNSGIVNSVS